MSRKRPQKFAAVLRPQTCLIMMMIPQSFPAPEETPESGRSQGEGKERGRADGAGEEVLPFQPERFYDSDRKFSADCGGGERAPPRPAVRVRPSVDRQTDRPTNRPSIDRPTGRTRTVVVAAAAAFFRLHRTDSSPPPSDQPSF